MADHGKTTLSTKLLEETGTLGLSMDRNPVYLDKLAVEKQRGITVKAQAATMIYTYKGEKYMLNLIDTPVLSVWSDYSYHFRDMSISIMKFLDHYGHVKVPFF